jgi:hypothetical protein
MNRLPLILPEPPALSDEGAAQCLDFLQELTLAFEKHYADQLRRFYEPEAPDHPDWFDPKDDPPPF